MMKQRRNCDLLNLLMLLSQQGPIGLALAWLVRLLGTWLRLVIDHRDLFSFDIAHNACAIPFVHVHSWSDVLDWSSSGILKVGSGVGTTACRITRRRHRTDRWEFRGVLEDRIDGSSCTLRRNSALLQPANIMAQRLGYRRYSANKHFS